MVCLVLPQVFTTRKQEPRAWWRFSSVWYRVTHDNFTQLGSRNSLTDRFGNYQQVEHGLSDPSASFHNRKPGIAGVAAVFVPLV